MDREAIKAVNVAFELNIPEHECILFLETAFSPQVIIDICNQSSGSYIAKDKSDGERLYKARALYHVAVKSSMGTCLVEDVVVPIDKLPAYLEFLKKISKKYEMIIPVAGHAGDGNVHPLIIYDPSSESSVQTSKKVFAEDTVNTR